MGAKIYKNRIFLLAVLLLAAAALLLARNYKKAFLPAEDFSRMCDSRDLFKKPRSLICPGIEKDISADLDYSGRGAVHSDLKIDTEVSGARLKGSLVLKGRALKTADGGPAGFVGKLSSDSMTLNSQPLLDFRMFFRINGDELKIYSLRFGKAYFLKGRIALKSPFETSLRLEIQRANIRDIALIAKAKNPDVVLGIMNGVFSADGPLNNLIYKGRLEGRSGRIGPVGYDTADIRFDGAGPIINIVDSRIKQGSGTFTIEGYIDTRNALKGNLFDGMVVRSDMKTVVWNGWDITESGAGELSLIRNVGEGVAVKFKTMAGDPLPSYYRRDSPEEVSLEYQLGAAKSFQLKLKENDEFLGVEHKTRF